MRVSASKRMGSVEWSLLVFLSVLWGGAFFSSKVALGELEPFTVVLGRVAIAAIALNLVVRARGHRMPSSLRIWGSFLIMGALNNLVPFSLIFWGQTRISSSLASILNATTPLWTVLLAHFFSRDERLTVNRLCGVLFGLGGVVIMIGPDVLRGLGLDVLAQVAVLGAAASYTFAGVFGKRFGGIPSHVTAAGQVTATAVMMTPIALWVDRPWQRPAPSATTWGAIFALGLLSTAIAYVIYFRLLSAAGATNLLLVTLLIPVSATLLGAAFLGERLAPRNFIGMALLGLSLGIIDGRLLSLLRARFLNAGGRPQRDRRGV